MRINKGKLGLSLTIVSTIGVVVSTALAVKDTKKAQNRLEKAKAEKGEELTAKEKIKVVAPIYIPTGLAVISTVTCIIGSNKLTLKERAALSSACISLDKIHKAYRNEVVNRYGDDVDKDICDTIYRRDPEFHQCHLKSPDKIVTFYDEISGHSIDMYERELMDAEYHFNRNHVLRGYSTLNHFYEMVGLPKIEVGDDIGWSMQDELYWVDIFHRKIESDEPGNDIYAIEFMFSPTEEAIEDWI